MKFEQYSEIIKKMKENRLPRWNDLPEIELYMDQVIVLMSKYTSPFTSKSDVITPSMINNYVKMGAIPAPVKKKYSRTHLARLLYICVLKRELPIQTVCKTIETLLQVHSQQQLFDMFVLECEHAFEDAKAHYSDLTEVSDENFTTTLGFQAVSLVARANACRLLAETTLNEAFGETPSDIAPKTKKEKNKKHK